MVMWEVRSILAEDRHGQVRKKLEAEREETVAEISRLREALKCELEYDTEEGDPDLWEREKVLALLRNMEQKLESIAHALRTMDDGTYGICENCGQDISPARLEALPHTTLCISCKALLEKRIAPEPLSR